MAIATFAGKTFEVNSDKIHTFSDLQFSGSLETEKQDSEGRKPSTYIKGPGLNIFSFKIKLDIEYGVTPEAEIESWIRLKDAAQPYYFIKAGKPFRNCLWLLVDVQESDETTDNSGNILSALLALKFEEYVRPGSKQEEKKRSNPGVYDEIYAKLNIGVSNEDKSALKRENVNMDVRASRNPVMLMV